MWQYRIEILFGIVFEPWDKTGLFTLWTEFAFVSFFITSSQKIYVFESFLFHHGCGFRTLWVKDTVFLIWTFWLWVSDYHFRLRFVVQNNDLSRFIFLKIEVNVNYSYFFFNKYFLVYICVNSGSPLITTDLCYRKVKCSGYASIRVSFFLSKI